MRLASKIFATSSLVIVLLAAVGALSLGAIGRLVSVNRKITTRAVPALRLTSTVRDAMLSLARLEARFLVLGDARYAALFDERARQAQDDLQRLGAFLSTRQERALHHDAGVAYAEYLNAVERERTALTTGDRARGFRIADRQARPAAERVEGSLDALTEATQTAVQTAQADAARLERHTWGGVLVALGAAVIVALLGTGLVAQRMTRSLRRLSEATAGVAAGAVREPIRIDDGDEIGELGRAFNGMVTELRQVDEMKEELFARLSHELRSPLTSVRESAHLLAEGVAGPLNPKQARLVTIVGASSDRLLRLVNQILELSRLRAGILTLERGHCDLERIAARAIEELRPQAEEGGVTLERERVGERFALVADEDRLLQVAVNLVGNAIRFTPRGGRVVARVVDARGELELQVEDTGVGIPASALPHIFDSYRQAHANRGGTGLGLAIVRGLVQAHGGRVTAESHEGKGSRFTVLLPRGENQA